MKSITVATIAAVMMSLLSVNEVAANDTTDAIILKPVTVKSTYLGKKADQRMINNNDIRVTQKVARKPMYLTRSRAPVMDASQPPSAISPPILAGTIPEDPPMREDRKKSKERNQGKGLFDRIFRRG